MPSIFYNKNQRDQIKYYSKSDPKVIDAKLIQKTIGLIALIWPIILIAGNWILTRSYGFEDSISAYYHTSMGHVFSGGLFIIGASMLAYKGFHCIDGFIGNIGGALAILVAICPIAPPLQSNSLCDNCNNLFTDSFYNYTTPVHYGAAFLLFVVLGYFCFAIFTLGSNCKDNQNYKLCGAAIAFFIIGMGIYKVVFANQPYLIFGKIDVFLLLEIFTLWAFGLSWLIKGDFFKAKSKKSYSPDYELLNKKAKEYDGYITEYNNKPKIKKPEKLFYDKKVLVETRECHRPKDPKCD